MHLRFCSTFALYTQFLMLRALRYCIKFYVTTFLVFVCITIYGEQNVKKQFLMLGTIELGAVQLITSTCIL